MITLAGFATTSCVLLSCICIENAHSMYVKTSAAPKGADPKTADPKTGYPQEGEDSRPNLGNATAMEVNVTYYREYVPLKRVPVPEVRTERWNSSEAYVAYDPLLPFDGKRKLEKEQEEEKVNLIILPLSTLIFMFAYACFKVSRWCHEDIREADDKMLRFFLPSQNAPPEGSHGKFARMPRRSNSVRSRSSQSTFRSNSFRSTDTEGSRRMCSGCQVREVGLDSPLAHQILLRKNRRYKPPIVPKAAVSASPVSVRQQTSKRRSQSKSRDSLRSKNGAKKRDRKARQVRREHELKLISMPLELHFSHMMLGRNRELPSASTPSSASHSTSTGISENSPLLQRSDSRKTSLDSGAVALGSQSSSQTDVTSTADTTTTTTGFSSESMSSPVGYKSPTSSKHVRSKGFIFPDTLPTSKPFWEHRRLVSSRSSEEAPARDLDVADGFIEDPFIFPLHGTQYSRQDSTSSSSVRSPKDTDTDFDLSADSPRSSISSDTAATVRYSPTKSGRSSFQDPGSLEISFKSTDSLSNSTTSLPHRQCQEFYVLTDISPPDISQHSLSSRENEISLKRDFARSNAMRKSLSADVTPCTLPASGGGGGGSHGSARRKRHPQRQRHSLDFDAQLCEMDCFKISNIRNTWCAPEPHSSVVSSAVCVSPDTMGAEHYC